MSDGFKYIFTMMDELYKIWIDSPIEDKSTKNILGAFKKCITTHNVLITLQIDDKTELKNNIVNQFYLKRNIQHISGTSYNVQHEGSVEAFNRKFKLF